MRLLKGSRQVLFDTRVVNSNLAKNLIVHNHNVSFTMNRIKIHKQLATQANSQKIRLFSLSHRPPVIKNKNVLGKYRRNWKS